MKWARGAELAAASLVLLAATLVVTWPLGAHLTTHATGHWDSFFSIWRLAWIADAVRSQELVLFDAPIFYPQLRALALSDAVLLPGLIVAPFRYLGIAPTIIYNAALLAGFVTSGLAMFVLVRSLTGRADAGMVGALIFMLAPYRLDHLDHLEMQMAAWMPTAFWLWHRAVDRGTAGAAAGAAGSVALQWLSCIYYGLLFAPLLGVMIAVEGVGVSRDRRGRVLAGLAIAAVAGVAVIAWYSLPYLANRDATGDRDAGSVLTYSATLSSYLGVSPYNALYGSSLSGFGGAEHRLFPGITALALAVLGLFAGPWDRRRWGYLAAGLLAVDLSLGANGIVFPLLREWVLPYRGLRAPGRAGVMSLLVVAVFAGFGMSFLAARLANARRAAVLAAVLGVVMLVEYRHPPDLWEAPPPTVVPELGLVRGHVVAEMPIAPPERLDLSVDASYMVDRIGTWPRLVNGYSGFHPFAYRVMADRVRAFPDGRSIRELSRLGVTVVTVHEWRYRERYATIIRELRLRTDVEPAGEYGEVGKRVAVFQILKL
jgi:hypothetical protein